MHDVLLSASVQVPPLRHGLEAHSSMLVWHTAPDHPGIQAHVKPLTASEQVPLLRHGEEAHSSILV
jgi:hypothetical protein